MAGIAPLALGMAPALLGNAAIGKMAGKGKGATPQAQITPQQIEAIKQAEHAWSRYEEVGIPAENRHIELLTGYKWDADKGAYGKSDAGPQVDNSAASRASNRATTKSMMENVGQSQGVLDSISNGMIDQEHSSASSMGLEQQTNQTRGVLNASAMLKGQQGTAIRSNTQLAQQANQDAIHAAGMKANKQAQNRYMAGNVLGMGLGYAARNAGAVEAPVPAQPTGNGVLDYKQG